MAAQEFTPEELASEEWRSVVGYEGRYEVSCLGRVKKLQASNKVPANYILKPTCRQSYKAVWIYREGGKKTGRFRSVHLLVAEAFLGPKPEGLQTNHIDGVKTNARIGNLEYVTPQENVNHAIRTGLFVLSAHCRRLPLDQKGEANPQAKLNDRDVIEVRRLLLAGTTGTAIARRFGVTTMVISHIKLGKSWAHLEPLREEVRAAVGKSFKVGRVCWNPSRTYS